MSNLASLYYDAKNWHHIYIDWARAHGADIANYQSARGFGCYWTRSPYDMRPAYTYAAKAYFVVGDGDIASTPVHLGQEYCVRPAITIKM